MKRIIMSAVALLLCAIAHAGASDSFILSRIESANENLRSAECNFHQVRSLAAAKTSVEMDGSFCFTSEGRLAMHYTRPEGEYFVVSDNLLYMLKAGKKTQYDLAKVPMMNSLVKTLFNCIQGRVRSLSSEVGADCTVEETASSYVVTLTARKKEVKGYAKIVLTYGRKDCMLEDMVMEEFSGVSNHYTFSSVRRNVAVPADRFSVR